MGKRNFAAGAMMLMTANAVSKILGAVYKIPLVRLIREEGMAVYNTAFSVYILFLSFVISGMPFAVQKLTAEAHARGDSGRAGEIVRYSTWVLAVVGLCGSAVMWFGADFLALAMKEEHAAAAIRAIAPSVLLVALGTAVKSGFQGRSQMLPTAVSQVIEAVIKLAAGYFFAAALASAGSGIASAGAAAGVSVGELVATLMLTIWYVAATKKEARGERSGIGGEIAAIALPMLFMSAASAAVSMCDTSVLRMSLIKALGSAERARFEYGAYTGYVLTILNLPAGLLATIGISMIPVISGAAAVGNSARIKSAASRAIVFSALCGIGAAAGLYCFGELLLRVLFKNTYSVPMLKMAAPAVMFICVMQICGAILQSLGCLWRAFAASAAAGLIKLLCSVFLASRPELGIYGAVIGTNAAFFAGMVINLIAVAGRISKKSPAVLCRR